MILGILLGMKRVVMNWVGLVNKFDNLCAFLFGCCGGVCMLMLLGGVNGVWVGEKNREGNKNMNIGIMIKI
nr:hypothetical protein [Staphylococcus auricularis]